MRRAAAVLLAYLLAIQSCAAYADTGISSSDNVGVTNYGESDANKGAPASHTVTIPATVTIGRAYTVALRPDNTASAYSGWIAFESVLDSIKDSIRDVPPQKQNEQKIPDIDNVAVWYLWSEALHEDDRQDRIDTEQ